jgi:general secretion pathway protein G
MTRPDARLPQASPAAPDLPDAHPRRRGRRRGFTLIELVITMVILGILAAIAIPNYSRLRERAFVARAIGDIETMSQNINEYHLTNGSLPSSLSDVGSSILDPWGNPYQYAPIGKGKGGFRKDRFLVPINTDYDLYSMGADGASVGPLTAAPSRDDIVRANDGGFVGLASEF